MVRMTMNSEITNILREKRIPIQDATVYLLSLHYGLKPTYIPEELKRKVLASGIATIEYPSETVKWLTPLFEEQEIGFEWISEWMDLFKAVNSGRRGVRADVLRRMKRFFANNPSIRKEEVFRATNKYLGEISNPVYCKKSHKFIYEIDGTSMLLDYVTGLSSIEDERTRFEQDVI
jgi:hypothetical protein